MNNDEAKRNHFMVTNDVGGDQLSLNRSRHSVVEAAEVIGTESDHIGKNICMMDSPGRIMLPLCKARLGQDLTGSKGPAGLASASDGRKRHS